MQLIPATARRFGVNDSFDPAQNINGGVQYLSFLLRRYQQDLTLAAAAYNAGEGAVDRYGGVPPYKETRLYVARVGQLAERYRKAL
jgi:soluble lytic murein transglycosylase-like protein